MRLVGAICWYDEDPAWLAATTASMCAVGMSHIVAVDGAYLAYPDAIRLPRSSPVQSDAICEVAEGMGVGYTIHAPSGPWLGGECEKRSFVFTLADLFCEEGDWVFLMDADQVITSLGDLPRALEETSEDVCEVMFYERGAGYLNGSPGIFPVRCVFRSGTGVQVVGRHYDYLLPDGTNLWGDPPLVPAARSTCEVEHRTRIRAAARKQAQEAYYARRDAAGLEQPVEA